MFDARPNKYRGRHVHQDRLQFLQKLVTEFQETDEDEDREEVLANLANFAYDPSNYQFLRDLKVIDLFLDAIHFGPEKHSSFAVGGLCNLCIDPKNKEIILARGGADIIAACLSSPNEEIVRNALTTLMLLIDECESQDILSQDLFDAVSDLATSVNPCIKNLATVFLEKIFK
ncbi:Armadillo repeat-containing protein 7 [Entomophthora muscae]|uniref:Armadillo repeat-containing protein 7 n=1 Tax=Entomophthora muscae TaxID=34485 RepID=A0ACC2RPM7_9FUNG|nr:Armadillo repeat-containing protein 7 [Entomophthora muscae]